jgi:glucose/arabinose dehydrogenase
MRTSRPESQPPESQPPESRWRRHTRLGRVAVVALALTAVLAGACSSGSDDPPVASAGSGAPASGPSGSASPPVVLPNERVLALRPTPVTVPAGLAAAPFNRPRTLTLPAGWTASVYARIPGARFLATTPDGRLLVSQPAQGKVLLVTPAASGAGRVSDFAIGLTRPHDMVFAGLSGRTWLYVAESNRVVRYPYQPGDARARPGQPVITGLPDDSTPELGGQYAHALKNLALGPDGTIYLSIGSSCNACVEDTRSDPQRGAIYAYDSDGSNRRLVARGLRNAEGLAFLPGTGDLWAVVNNRDNIPYPYHQDFDNKAPKDDFGKVLPGYVDNHPPEEFVHVTVGAFFGWPFCNPNPDRTIGMQNMPLDPDAVLNADRKVDCYTASRIHQGIQAHSAPLGLTFLQQTQAPELIRTGAAIALHGSWNRQQPTGYKVVWFPWHTPRARPGRQQDLVTGWLDEAHGPAWGRPVDIAVDRDGSLLVSDDFSGTVYRLAAG